jgi:PKD repeat protein
MGINRNNLLLLLFFITLSVSGWAQFAPEKMKGGLFVENKGQWDDKVLYRSEIPSGQLYIEKNRFLFNFYDQAAMSLHHTHGIKEQDHSSSQERLIIDDKATKKSSIQAHAYEVEFLGCSPISSTKGEEPTAYNYNYFKGNDKTKWGTNVHAYSKTILNDIYPKTSLVCFGQETGFKYEFHLQPGANVASIQLKYKGVDSVFLKNGELFIETSVTDFYEQKPFAYQEINGQNIQIPCSFKLLNNILSFDFPKGYNKKFPLVIDPQLIFSTYSGSYADNWGNSATYDEKGNTYMVGIAFGIGYPVTVGAYQINYNGYKESAPNDTICYGHIRNDTLYCDSIVIFKKNHKFDPDIAIMKFDPLGNILYATYLGGSETEMPSSCIVNSKNELVLFGVTSSDGRADTTSHTPIPFPTTIGAYNQICKSGSYTRPFGETDPIYFDHGSDLFICALSELGNTLSYSTFIGGDSLDGLSLEFDPVTRNYGDQLRGEIYCDELDNVYIVSKTNSANIINTSVPGYDQTFNGKMDAYVCKMSPDLSTMIWNTFVGGDDYDAGYSIRVASDKSVYITGGTTSKNFPGVSSGLKNMMIATDTTDGFIAHLSSDGTTLLNATYVGTDSYDQCFFIQLDAAENIYVLGQTQGDYLMSPSVYGQPSTGQFIQKINPDLSISLLSTTIGNKKNSICLVPTAFLVNNCDNLLISGWGGNTNHYSDNYLGGYTNNLPTTPNALYRITDNSDFYLMVLEKEFKSLLYATYYGGFGEDDHVDGGTSRFDKNGIVYQSVCASCWTQWPNPSTSVFPVTDGSKKRSTNCNNACFKFDLSDFTASFTASKTSGCGEDTIIFTNTSTGGVTFDWDLGDGTKISGLGPIIHSYKKPGTYIVKLIVTDLTTCIGKDTAKKTITIFPFPSIGVHLTDTTICQGDTIQILHTCMPNYAYTWSPSKFITDTNVCDAKFFPNKPTTYYLHVLDENGCILNDTLNFHVATIAKDLTWENMTQCKGKPTVRLSNASTGPLNYFWTFGDGSSSKEPSPIHEYSKGGSYPIVLNIYNDYCSSTEVGVVKIDDIKIPNLFTPNQDGKNDCFEIVGLYPGWKVEVYNPWNSLVFKSDSYQNQFCADGLSTSVYYYLVCAPYGDCCKSWVHIISDK